MFYSVGCEGIKILRVEDHGKETTSLKVSTCGNFELEEENEVSTCSRAGSAPEKACSCHVLELCAVIFVKAYGDICAIPTKSLPTL